MKKIVFLGLFVISVGCSDESQTSLVEQTNNVVITSSHKINNNIDQYFFDYINSAEFKQTNILLKNFCKKMKISTTPPLFTSDQEIRDFLYTYISGSDFTSIDQAMNEYNSIKVVFTQCYSNHLELFNFIQISENSTVLYYYNKWIFPEYTSNKTGNTENFCYEDLKSCEKNARDTYTNNFALHNGGPKALDNYMQDCYFFMQSMICCADTFEACEAIYFPQG